jgi:hypothetical protein
MGRTEFPDLNFDYEPALVGYGTFSIRAKWRALGRARISTLQKAPDTADIVTEAC